MDEANTQRTSDEATGRRLVCGCVLCTCEDEAQCHGCGAKFCDYHNPNAPPSGGTAASGEPSVAQEQLSKVRELLDAEDVPAFFMATQTTGHAHRDFRTMSIVERVRALIDGWKSPANKTAFACVQLLNALKHLRDIGRVLCDCTHEEGYEPGGEHNTTCPIWQLNFVIAGFEREFLPEDAEIWLRVVTLIYAIQQGRQRGMRVGHPSVPELPLDELAEIADGRPRDVTDAYASMESLRKVLAKLRVVIDSPLGPGPKVERARTQGYREALKHVVKDIEDVVDWQTSDICAGLIEFFGVWLMAHKDGFEVGHKAEAGPMAAAVSEFISVFKLRRINKEERGS